MSDSPLDGGTGWPTSAYTLVPRPAVTPAETPSHGPMAAPRSPSATSPEPRTEAEPGSQAEPGSEAGPGSDAGPRSKTESVTEASAGDPTAPARRTGGPERHSTTGGGAPETEPAGDAGSPPDAGDGRRRTLAVVGTLVAVLGVALIVSVIVLANRRSAGADDPDDRVSTQAPAVAGPTGGAEASGAPAGSTGANGSAGALPNGSVAADPSANPAIPMVPGGGTTDVLRSGTVRLTVIAGRPDETFDLDTGTKEAPNTDIAAAAVGLNATNGARFAPWTQPDPPSAAGCAAMPDPLWSTSVVLAAVLPGTTVCVKTSEQRPASFVTRTGDAITDGQLYTTYLEFTVWKKVGD